MAQKQFELTLDDLLDAAETLLKNRGDLAENDKLNTVDFQYDKDNNVSGIVVKQ